MPAQKQMRREGGIKQYLMMMVLHELQRNGEKNVK
jgi:hypothetical protein